MTSQSSSGDPVMSDHRPLLVGENAVQQVLLCDLYRRTTEGPRGSGSSLPGHLLQLMLEGRTEHEVGGRRYTLEPGHLIWYHEDELVKLNVLAAPWSFYTLNFIAKALEPPPFEHRVRKVGPKVRRRFAGVLAAWRAEGVTPVVRELRVHAALSALLAEVLGGADASHGPPFQMDASARLWWELESRLRQDLAQPIDLTRLAAMTGRSPATIARACRVAVNQPPMKRVKRIRLSLARGLVLRSALSMTEIAGRVGYGRPHEFSRDYRKHFGVAPRDDRRRGA